MRVRFTAIVVPLLVFLAVVPAFAQMMPGGGMSRQQFVQGYYANVLGRTPSAGEVSAWQAFLVAMPGAAGGRIMTHAFFDGPEYRSHPTTPGMDVTAMYRALLGRDPSPGEQEPWVQHMLDRWMDPTVTGFTGSAEFHARVPSAQDRSTVTALITRMYQQALNRTPSVGEVTPWVDWIMANGDPAPAVRAILRSSEYVATPRTLEQHAVVMYRAILGRDPTPDEIAAWANFMAAQMASVEDEFTGAPEFAARCASLF